MDNNRKLAHIVAYYLSRFDREGLTNLGYRSFNEAFEKSGKELDVKPNYIKLNRDEFDVEHPHRKGWRNRPMAPSVLNVINALKDLDEPTLRSIVLDILAKGKDPALPEDFESLVTIIPDEKKKKRKQAYIPRNITGRKAEEIFINWYKSDQKTFPQGKDFVDMRDYGCGYDFQIVISDKQIYAIEVKGIAEDEGGILITGKEWETASVMKTDYYLVIVKNVDTNPVISVINNPYKEFSPKRNLQTVVQAYWTISSKEIRKITEEK